MGALSAWSKNRKITSTFGILLVLTGLLSAPALLDWQRLNEQRTFSLSNLRRLTLALQIYAQDYDGCLPVPAEKRPDGSWLTFF